MSDDGGDPIRPPGVYFFIEEVAATEDIGGGVCRVAVCTAEGDIAPGTGFEIDTNLIHDFIPAGGNYRRDLKKGHPCP